MSELPSEKRRFYRHPVGIPIRYEPDTTHHLESGTSLDLSEGGISFLCSHIVQKGTPIHLSIPVEDEVFKIQGKVAYCNKALRGESYRIGVCFKDKSDAFRAKLAEEMLKIKTYQKKRSVQLGREISEEEAAIEWIKKYAKNFAELF
jgi:hypothetical protein